MAKTISMVRSLCLRFVVALVFVAACLYPAIGETDGSTAPLSLESIKPGAEVRVRREMNFEVSCFPAEEPWVGEVLSRADNARRILHQSTPDVLLVTIRILLVPDREALVALAGAWAENSAAVAIPWHYQIIVNADAMRVSPSGTLATTLVHEFAHLYLGARCRQPLPRWLNEGLAMHVAGEWTIEDSGALVLARLFGRLIPLRDLINSFPVQADRQQLAYRQSYSMVQFLAGRCEPTNVKALIGTIIGDPGREQIAAYWNPLTRDMLEAAWVGSLRAPWNWALLSFNTGILWGGGALLLVIAWLVRRRRSRLQHAEWDEEERIYEVLDEEEAKTWADPDAPEEEEGDGGGGKRPPWYD